MLDDSYKILVRCLGVLHVLLLEVLQLADYVLFPTSQCVNLEVIVLDSLNFEHQIEESGFAVLAIIVGTWA